MAQLQANAFVYNGQKVLHENCHYFNHSCAPNACLYEYDNFVAAVYVIEPIKAGEEICIAYRPEELFLPKSRRQQTLQASHGFLCCCSRCETPHKNDYLLTAAYNLPTDKHQLQLAINLMEEQFNSLDPHNNSNIYHGVDVIIKQLEQFLVRPFTQQFPNATLDKAHWRMNLIRQDLIGLYISTQQYAKALELLIEQMKCEELIYPKYHNQKLLALRTYLLIFERVSKEDQIKYSQMAQCLDWNVYRKIETIFKQKSNDSTTQKI
jgi:hypothetical protein